MIDCKSINKSRVMMLICGPEELSLEEMLWKARCTTTEGLAVKGFKLSTKPTQVSFADHSPLQELSACLISVT